MMEELRKNSNTSNSVRKSPSTPSRGPHKREEARENAKRDRQGSDWFCHDRPNTPTTPLLSEYGEAFTDSSSTTPLRQRGRVAGDQLAQSTTPVQQRGGEAVDQVAHSTTPVRQRGGGAVDQLAQSTTPVRHRGGGAIDQADHLSHRSRGSQYLPSPSKGHRHDGRQNHNTIDSKSNIKLQFDTTPDMCVFKSPLRVVSCNTKVLAPRANPVEWFRHDKDSPDLNRAVSEEDLMAILDEIDDEDATNTVGAPGIATVHGGSLDNAHCDACSCGGDWFTSHENHSTDTASRSCGHVYRGHAKEGELNPALRTAQESESWFDYEANRNYTSPCPLVRGAGVPRMLNKERSGQQMSDILHMK